MLGSKSGFRGGGAGDRGRRAETSGRSLADRDRVNASDRAGRNPLPGLQLDHAAAVKIDEEIERAPRSEERRVGKECGSTCRSRWSPYHEKKNKLTATHLHIPSRTQHRNRHKKNAQ